MTAIHLLYGLHMRIPDLSGFEVDDPHEKAFDVAIEYGLDADEVPTHGSLRGADLFSDVDCKTDSQTPMTAASSRSLGRLLTKDKLIDGASNVRRSN